MSAGERPLLSYIVAQFKLHCPNMDEESVSSVKDALEKYILGKMQYDECNYAVSQLAKNTKALDQLKSILNTPLQPPIGAVFTQTSAEGRKTRPWNSIEDQRLLAAINKFGLDNWVSVASFVGNRTRSQCSQRWMRGLDPHISKSHWSQEQDEKLLYLVARFGNRSWTAISADMANRCDVQCRYRFLQLQKERGFSMKMEEAIKRVQDNHEELFCGDDPRKDKNGSTRKAKKGAMSAWEPSKPTKQQDDRRAQNVLSVTCAGGDHRKGDDLEIDSIFDFEQPKMEYLFQMCQKEPYADCPFNIQ